MRAREPEANPIRELRTEARLPGPDAAGSGIVGITRGSIRNQPIVIQPRYADLAEDFGDIHLTDDVRDLRVLDDDRIIEVAARHTAYPERLVKVRTASHRIRAVVLRHRPARIVIAVEDAAAQLKPIERREIRPDRRARDLIHRLLTPACAEGNTDGSSSAVVEDFTRHGQLEDILVDP